MTRACLRWAVLMAALGSVLMLATRSEAQICTDYYRFGPTYSNTRPFVEDCMEAYGEEHTAVTAATDGQDDLDLSGRVVVAVLDDPVVEDAVDYQDQFNDFADEQVDELSLWRIF